LEEEPPDLQEEPPDQWALWVGVLPARAHSDLWLDRKRLLAALPPPVKRKLSIGSFSWELPLNNRNTRRSLRNWCRCQPYSGQCILQSSRTPWAIGRIWANGTGHSDFSSRFCQSPKTSM